MPCLRRAPLLRTIHQVQVDSLIAACTADREEQHRAGTGAGVTAFVIGADGGAAGGVAGGAAGQAAADSGSEAAPASPSAAAAALSPTVIIRLQSSSGEALAGAKRALEDTLAGERALFPFATRHPRQEREDAATAAAAADGAPADGTAAASPAWADELTLPEGTRFLKELGLRTGAFLYRDTRRREIRVFGEARTPLLHLLPESLLFAIDTRPPSPLCVNQFSVSVPSLLLRRCHRH